MNLCNAGCLQQRSRGLFKSDRGALSAKESREMLLTTPREVFIVLS